MDILVPFINTGTVSYNINYASIIPDRQHRRFGGNVDGTKLGWVMYEADRAMKCLAIGKDNLVPNVTYSSVSTNLASVPGFSNLLERCEGAGITGNFNARMWFVPNDMNLDRDVDPATGLATIVFDNPSNCVSLLTESYLQGVPASPIRPGSRPTSPPIMMRSRP